MLFAGLKLVTQDLSRATFWQLPMSLQNIWSKTTSISVPGARRQEHALHTVATVTRITGILERLAIDSCPLIS
jgi:hypothetical protein